MIKERNTNILIVTTLILIGIGIIMVYSASSIFAQKRLGDSFYFLKKQAIFSLLGIFLMSGAMKIKAKIYKNPYLVYFLLALSFFLLILLLVPGIGYRKGGSMRWFRLGPLSFQPSEFSKLSLVIFLSYFLAKYKDEIKTFTKGFLIPFLVTGLLFLLILRQPDFGSGILLMSIMTMMLFVSGTRMRYLLSLIVILGVIFSGLVMLVPYRLQRFIAFLDPWKDPKGVGFQIIQSTLAFASGGLWGRGLGNGMQKLFYLPEPHTDFILSVIGEEWGLLGLSLVIFLFLILIV
ncbi:MAG: FtsW/RodA/SpoVE family cell cycle protein, partial [bacterium]|nr:FtsW/RodA/SpoVE family cell cycle protein [bacterium]